MKLLADNAPKAMKEQKFESYFGRKIAIDASMSIYQFLETCFGMVHRKLLHSRDEILSFIVQCVVQLPHKIPLYGTLVGLINLEDEDFVKGILEKTHDNLQLEGLIELIVIEGQKKGSILRGNEMIMN